MSLTNNRAIVRRYFAEVWNQGDVAVIDELVAPTYLRHNDSIPAGGVSGSDALKRIVTSERLTFPDLAQSIEDMISEADRVTVRLKSSGTMRGKLLEHEPTGKHFTIPAIHIIRLSDGRIQEEWLTVNVIGILSQLELTPALRQLLQPFSGQELPAASAQ
ncbi:MAG TPA: ester cyclase [Thermomicrobiales bacterium]|nr:ester cyclase [Thermomicrobiales bacterium]